MKEVISLKGDRILWMSFINKLRFRNSKSKKKDSVWDILEPVIKDYTKPRDGEKW